MHGSPRFISFEKFTQIGQTYSGMYYSQATFPQARYPIVILPCSGLDVTAITCCHSSFPNKYCNENLLAEKPYVGPKLSLYCNKSYNLLVGNLGLVHSEEVIFYTDLVTVITPGLTWLEAQVLIKYFTFEVILFWCVEKRSTLKILKASTIIFYHGRCKKDIDVDVEKVEWCTGSKGMVLQG